MAELNYVKGDATRPQGPGTKVICHCCNDEGGWGSGFVVALSNHWSAPEAAYRRWCRERETPSQIFLDERVVEGKSHFQLGSVQLVQVNPDIWVANIIGQHKTISSGEQRPIRYDAIQKGLALVREFCEVDNKTVHMPRMGAGLARGNWVTIEDIILRELVVRGVGVTVYDL